ncbi:hypothetical protein AB0K34_14045 [Actinomadura sp. NPDC049382]|uniref:hypothetical protein n=1 Tax=Actinomadura sp. NPDC049382 TaxID=3158220 RepID=UPI00343660C7
MSLLARLESAVQRRDFEKARDLFDELQLQQPDMAAEILARLRLSDEDAAAIGAA